jgi:hypothetical protein
MGLLPPGHFRPVKPFGGHRLEKNARSFASFAILAVKPFDRKGRKGRKEFRWPRIASDRYWF